MGQKIPSSPSRKRKPHPSVDEEPGSGTGSADKGYLWPDISNFRAETPPGSRKPGDASKKKKTFRIWLEDKLLGCGLRTAEME